MDRAGRDMASSGPSTTYCGESRLPHKTGARLPVNILVFGNRGARHDREPGFRRARDPAPRLVGSCAPHELACPASTGLGRGVTLAVLSKSPVFRFALLVAPFSAYWR